MRDMGEILEIVDRLPGTDYAKQIRCKLCKDIVFLVEDNATDSDMGAEMVRLNAHMSIQHQITIQYHKCDDPECRD